MLQKPRDIERQVNRFYTIFLKLSIHFPSSVDKKSEQFASVLVLRQRLEFLKVEVRRRLRFAKVKEALDFITRHLDAVHQEHAVQLRDINLA